MLYVKKRPRKKVNVPEPCTIDVCEWSVAKVTKKGLSRSRFKKSMSYKIEYDYVLLHLV